MHKFIGKWITDCEFSELEPRNVFQRHLNRVELQCDEHRNCHILFRKKFYLEKEPENTTVYISADDYYKLYINGSFVGQGPTMSYHMAYNYNVIDISEYVHAGENTIAVHTLYQGLINRVWQSGDNRHGLILDLYADGKLTLCSDSTFKTCRHTAYKECGTTAGFHQTQFLENYDSNAREVGFEKPEFDDSYWEYALINKCADHILVEQKTKMLEFEKIMPKNAEPLKGGMLYDFGSNYAGYFSAVVEGKKGDIITIRCGQELNDDGSIRYEIRANCCYEENWILSDSISTLEWFDYKAFRYVEVIYPEGISIREVHLNARHYPFTLRGIMKPEYQTNEELSAIWNLCVHTQKYGVQEAILDCMDREKGFYLGDGCYSVLANIILTQDDSMVRKLIDDAFSTNFVTEGLLTCMDCSRMHEIAEFPLIMLFLILWHYRLFGDIEYLKVNYDKSIQVLEHYRKNYEYDHLLKKVDKWCVVEWPPNYRDNYDVDIRENFVCEEPHVSINAYYIQAIKTVNKMAEILGLPTYRDITPLKNAFFETFYNKEKHLFKDGQNTEHISIVGNSFPFGFDLCPDPYFKNEFIKMLKERKFSSLSFFTAFTVLSGKKCLMDEGAWLRMLKEDATTTFEGWGKETKSNASLFHMTMSYAAVFIADIDHKKLFE